MSKKSNYKYVWEIFKPDIITGISEWKSRDELETTKLSLGNNGGGRHGIYFGVPDFIWDTKRKNNTKTGKREKIRTNGFNIDTTLYRPISNKIRNFYKDSSCIICDNNDIVIDHKNDLYNDKRVLNIDTQTIDDFQPLCNSCNLRKRQVCKKSKELGLRYKATHIPMMSVFNIDFIEGNETLDIYNPNAMKGTYWYDPKKFMEYINSKRKI